VGGPAGPPFFFQNELLFSPGYIILINNVNIKQTIEVLGEKDIVREFAGSWKDDKSEYCEIFMCGLNSFLMILWLREDCRIKIRKERLCNG
jgi:hypothetical protein